MVQHIKKQKLYDYIIIYLLFANDFVPLLGIIFTELLVRHMDKQYICVFCLSDLKKYKHTHTHLCFCVLLDSGACCRSKFHSSDLFLKPVPFFGPDMTHVPCHLTSCSPHMELENAPCKKCSIHQLHLVSQSVCLQ